MIATMIPGNHTMQSDVYLKFCIPKFTRNVDVFSSMLTILAISFPRQRTTGTLYNITLYNITYMQICPNFSS